MAKHKFVDRTLVICGVLALLTAGGYSGIQVISAHHSYPTWFNFNNTHHLSNYAKGIRDAHHDYNNHDDTSVTDILNTTLGHDLLSNSKYRSGYQRAFKSINIRHHLITNHENSKLQSLIKAYLNCKNETEQSGIRKGYLDDSTSIPSVYRNDIHYAKGFMYGVHHAPDSDSRNSNTVIANYQDYQSLKGQIPLRQLAGKDVAKVYMLSQKVISHENLNAIAHPHKYETQMYQKSQLSLEYHHLYEETLSNATGVKSDFASGLFKKFPLHKVVNFPSSVVNGQKHSLNGVILGYSNNDRALQTVRNYIKYTNNLYQSQPSSKISQQFKAKYRDNKISQANGAGDYVCIYKIRLRNPTSQHQENDSTIYYVMPQGNEGYIPRT